MVIPLKSMAMHLKGLEFAGADRSSKVCSSHTTNYISQKIVESMNFKSLFILFIGFLHYIKQKMLQPICKRKITICCHFCCLFFD